ncbi:MAG: HEPN domain-containing protein [Ignavibacteriaceae bacterium]
MNEKIEVVKSWIEKGDHDLGTAQITFIHIPKFRDTIAFHCQQAVEKYIKSYLLFLDIQFGRSHDLNYLLSLLIQKAEVENDLFDKASRLADFSVEIRYPDTTIELSDDDVKDAINIAKGFREFVLKRMNLSIDYDEVK